MVQESPCFNTRTVTSLVSDLVGCLEDMIPPQENVARPHVEIIILDGAAITNMLAPGGAKTLCEYATQVFLKVHHISATACNQSGCRLG